MLELNPGDNQGLRYSLMGLYLNRADLQGTRRLFEQYEDEVSAVFAWSRVLERLLTGDEDGAEAALREAREVNPHVEPMLLDNRKIPRETPSYYSLGDPSEVVMCIDSINDAWKRHRKAKS